VVFRERERPLDSLTLNIGSVGAASHWILASAVREGAWLLECVALHQIPPCFILFDFQYLSSKKKKKKKTSFRFMALFYCDLRLNLLVNLGTMWFWPFT
jgi:hypothetical protein